MAEDKPFTVQEALRQASVSLLTGNPEMAERFYRAVLEADPQNAEAQNGLRDLLSSRAGIRNSKGSDQEGRGKHGGKKAGKRLSAEPGQDDIHGLLALFNTERLADAEARARFLIQRFPNALILFDVLAATQARQGKLEAAAASYRRALEIKPDFAEAYNNLGNALQDLGRFDEAVTCYRQAVKFKPRFAEAFSNMGTPLRKLGRLDEAIASYRQALKIRPDLAGVHGKLGAALWDMGRLDEAESCTRQAVKISPRSAADRLNLGVMLYRLGKHEEALSCFRQALKNRPDFAEAHYNLGITLTALGGVEEAVACYRQAVKLKPDYADAYNNLGNLLGKLERYDEALASYRQALTIRPDFANAAHMIAAISGETTSTAPEEYVVELFDNYASNFDRSLVESLKYDIPNKIATLLRETFPEVAKFGRVLDLGCGTGLSGIAFRNLADHLSGVDLSSEMIRKAREKNLYDVLARDEIVNYVENTRMKFDLFMSADVFVYLGDLERIFAAVSTCAPPGAFFCFSVETPSGEGFKLRPSGRYAHSRRYIENLYRKYSFVERASRETDIRTEKGAPIIGEIYVLERT